MKHASSGSIIIDIMLAIALAAVFAVVIAGSSREADDLFADAREKDGLLRIYESHAADFASLMPGGSYSVADGGYRLEAQARWYGDDRIETDVTVSDPTRLSSDSKASFAAVRAYPFPGGLGESETPICSADLSDIGVVGSYSASQAASTSTSLRVVPVTLPIDPSLPLTDLEVRDGIAYVSVDSSVASDPDLIVADIHDQAHPVVRSSINTGPGIAAIALAGHYAYAAASSAAAQLHVIRLDDTDGLRGPNALALVERYKLPPPYATATEPLGSAISYSDGIDGPKVYLGTEKWDGAEFSVIDVSLPTAPTVLSATEVGSRVGSISVSDDDIAYIATAARSQLIAVDISDPYQPRTVDQFSPSGWTRQEGKTVSLFEDGLSFGRTSGGYDIPTDFEAFTWPTGSASSSSGLSSSPYPLNVPGGVYGIVTDRRHVFLATRQVDKELQVFDRTLSATSSLVYALPVAPETMTCDGDKLYVLSHTAPVIYEIDFD